MDRGGEPHAGLEVTAYRSPLLHSHVSAGRRRPPLDCIDGHQARGEAANQMGRPVMLLAVLTLDAKCFRKRQTWVCVVREG